MAWPDLRFQSVSEDESVKRSICGDEYGVGVILQLVQQIHGEEVVDEAAAVVDVHNETRIETCIVRNCFLTAGMMVLKGTKMSAF